MSKLYIKFGVHKDREVLKKMRDQISGICVPAHILAYTPDPTKAAIFYAQKPFFIDPMTYRYAESDIGQYVTLNKEKENKFKPSMAKLTKLYELEDFFERNNYAPLVVSDADNEFIATLSKRVIDLQRCIIQDGKEGAIERYADLLAKLGKQELISETEKDHKPEYYIPPYFFYESTVDPWYKKNIAFVDKTKELAEESENIVPMILTNAATLETDILDVYGQKGITHIALWLSDLNEKSEQNGAAQTVKLRNYIAFAKKAQHLNIKIIAMHSSYFSVILSKFGVSAVCHGLLHGEYKNKKAQIGGGAPPSRYYIRAIHHFLPVTQAQRLFDTAEGIDLLDTDSDPCMSLIKGNARNIYDMFESNTELSQIHFLHARNEEINSVNRDSLSEIIEQMQNVYDNKKSIVEKVSKEGALEYLSVWCTVLGEIEEEE